jgi:hypothetical protein
VRSNRALRADRIPSGFAQGRTISGHAAFSAAEIGGSPGQGLIPYELRFSHRERGLLLAAFQEIEKLFPTGRL